MGSQNGWDTHSHLSPGIPRALRPVRSKASQEAQEGQEAQRQQHGEAADQHQAAERRPAAALARRGADGLGEGFWRGRAGRGRGAGRGWEQMFEGGLGGGSEGGEGWIGTWYVMSGRSFGFWGGGNARGVGGARGLEGWGQHPLFRFVFGQLVAFEAKTHQRRGG